MNAINSAESLFLLGRRIERLFFAGILIILLAIAEAYLTTASRQFSEDRSITVTSILLTKFINEEEKLKKIFSAKSRPPAPAEPQGAEIYTSEAARTRVAETRKKLGLPPPAPPKPSKKEKPPKIITYAEAIEKILDDVAIETKSTKAELSKSIDPRRPPEDIIRNLQSEKTYLEEKPATVWGLQTARFLPFQYAGLDYRFPFTFLSTVLAIALGPLIIGWLGAVYMTRQRELMTLAKIDDYKYAFPHLINLLPVRFDWVEKKLHIHRTQFNRSINGALNRIMLSIARSIVILIFALPMLWGFTYSLFQLWIIGNETFTTPIYLGGLIAVIMIFESLILVIQEWTILHNKEYYES